MQYSTNTNTKTKEEQLGNHCQIVYLMLILIVSFIIHFIMHRNK